jgi:hypothetical protein
VIVIFVQRLAGDGAAGLPQQLDPRLPLLAFLIDDVFATENEIGLATPPLGCGEAQEFFFGRKKARRTRAYPFAAAL